MKKAIAEILDWLQRGELVIKLLGAIGTSQIVRALLVTRTMINPVWVTPIWMLSAAVVLWVFVKYAPLHISRVQQPDSQSLVIPPAIQETIKMLDGIYNGIDSRITQEQEDGLNLELRQIPSLSERERVLSRTIIVLAVFFDFESIWYNIYASQIEMLQELNGKALKREGLFEYYIRAATAFPGLYSTYSFEQWIGFMRTQILLREDGDKINITVKGRAFLKYLIDHGRSASGRMF